MVRFCAFYVFCRTILALFVSPVRRSNGYPESQGCRVRTAWTCKACQMRRSAEQHHAHGYGRTAIPNGYPERLSRVAGVSCAHCRGTPKEAQCTHARA